ncbi:hypothetical protein [Actinocorallia longicatena]|uniref:Repeat protein (TIGR01451 family) n=1 Tax=Actinocorallia longicatena TaxID=111803 RepID=A0ABP6QE98_9ACTN
MRRLTGVVLFGLVLAPASAADARPRPPMLSIKLDDARTQVTPGDEVTYRIVVNSDEPKGLPTRVELSLPRGMTAVRTSGSGRISGSKVSWAASIAPAGRTLLTATGRLPRGVAGDAVTSTACVTAPGHGASPLVCSGDIDALPSSDALPVRALLPLWAATAAAALAAVAGVLHWRSRRRRRAAA